MITKYNIFENVDEWINLLDYLNENDLKSLNRVIDAYKYRENVDNNIAVKEYLSYTLKGKLIKIHYDDNDIVGLVSKEIVFGSNQPYINIGSKEDRAIRFRTIDFCMNPNIIQVYSETEQEPRVRWFKHGKLQKNDDLNEYVDFSHVPDYMYINKNNKFFGGGKEIFVLQDRAKLVRMGLLKDFIQIDNWYRIKFDDYRYKVIKVMETSANLSDIFTIGYMFEYRKGEIRPAPSGFGTIKIDTWNEKRNIIIEHIELAENRENRNKFKNLNIKINDIVKVSNPGLEDIEFRITNINNTDHYYWSRVKGKDIGVHKIMPLEIVENLGNELIGKIAILKSKDQASFAFDRGGEPVFTGSGYPVGLPIKIQDVRTISHGITLIRGPLPKNDNWIDKDGWWNLANFDVVPYEEYEDRIKELWRKLEKEKEERRLKQKELDPYGEEVWESKKSKKRNATRIKMAEIDPYGEEDWGWDVKINDDDFKDKYIVFKKKFLGSYDYYFAFLTSHYQIHSFGGTQDLNIIKKHQVLSPISEREIERIKKDKIELVPYHWVGKYNKNEYGNAERVRYSSLNKDVLFLDQDYMDNYLYMNESKINENFKVGDSILCVYDKYPNLTGEIVFVDDSHFNSYTVKLDREVRGKLFYPIKSEKALKITYDEREKLCKKFDKDKEELSLINIDIDPYGEEIWNESKINEYVEFNKTGEELELKRWHNYFEDYIVPFLRKGEWYRIICEIPYDKNDYDVLERPGKENKLITKKRKKMLLYVFRFHSTHSDWGWNAIMCDRIYKHGEIEEVNPFKDYIQMDKLRDYKEVKIQHIFNTEINRKREELRLKLHPNDPYGEEEWND